MAQNIGRGKFFGLGDFRTNADFLTCLGLVLATR